MQMEKAKGIVADNRGKSRAQLRAILEAEKIEPKVVNRLAPEEQKQQKKGLLASLFGG